MRIDVHSHVILPEMLGAAGPYGPEVRVEGGQFVMRVGQHVSIVRVPEGEDGSADALSFMDEAPARLAEMDEKGIDMMGVNISPLFYLYWAEPAVAVPFTRVLNDAPVLATREDPAAFRQVFDVNLFGAYWMAQAAARSMRRGGSIINVGSVLAYKSGGLPQAAYASSKSALLGLTTDLAQQWSV